MVDVHVTSRVDIGDGHFDLFNDLKNLATKVKASATIVATEVNRQFKPMTKAIRKVDHKVFGGLYQGFFDVEKGVVNGLDEVVGTPVDIKDVKFYVATAENRNNLTQVNFFKPDAVHGDQTFIIIHGWQSSHNASWCLDLANVLLDKYPKAHVVLVGWEKGASDNYAFSAFNTESVGYLVGIFINRLVSEYHVPKTNFVLIGHSLGSHIAGWAGKKFKEIRGETLPIIIALDPAGPLFTFRPDNRRLNKHDAGVVLVVHTDGGLMGFLERCGTIDFFPNGGSGQPGCAKVNVQSIQSIVNPLICSHTRAHDYFIEAVNASNSFIGRKCPSYGHFQMNYNCDAKEADIANFGNHPKGSFYLQTASESPFSISLRKLDSTKDQEEERRLLEKQVEEWNSRIRILEKQREMREGAVH